MSCPWENNFSCITQGNSTLSLVFKTKDYYGNIMKQGKHLKQNNEQIKRSRVSVVIKNKQNKRRIKNGLGAPFGSALPFELHWISPTLIQ